MSKLYYYFTALSKIKKKNHIERFSQQFGLDLAQNLLTYIFKK
jgi:hypothetical protein